VSTDGEEGNEQIARFLNDVFDRYGYDLRGYAQSSLCRRIHLAVHRSGAQGVDELREKVLAEPVLFARVLDVLTVQVTEMFRDPLFFRAFRDQVVPLLRTYARLSIWTCGVATGEEAYSLAILLLEEGLYDRCQIYATDLSSAALEQAKEGVYPEASVATLSENHARAGGKLDLSSCFTRAYDRIAICNAVRRNVVFFQHDLVGDHVFGEMDVILCRNVVIYFGRDLQRRVLRKLADSLRPGGFLCLGSSERPPRAVDPSFTDFVPGQHIYRLAS